MNFTFTGLNNGKIKLWKSSTKGVDTELSFTDNKIEYDLTDANRRTEFGNDLRNHDLYVEGYEASLTAKDSQLKLVYEDGVGSSYEVCVDPVKVTVLRLEATDMSFNHDRTGHATDAVNIRKSYAGAQIEAPEWQVDSDDAGTDPQRYDEVCYVKETRVSIKTSFSIAPAAASARIRALGTREAIAGSTVLSLGNLGDAQDQEVSWKTVTFTAGQAANVVFTPKNRTSSKVLQEKALLQWLVTEVGGVSIPAMKFTPADKKKPILIYTTWDDPASPWDTADGAGNKKQPWATALKFAIETASMNNKHDFGAIVQLTDYLHGTHGMIYDTGDVNGAGRPSFTFNGNLVPGGTFALTNYINKTTTRVNCYDQAGAVCALARLVGIPACYKFMNPFGFIPTSNVVGVGNTNNPFWTYLVALGFTAVQNAGNDSTMATVGDRRAPFTNHAFVECATTGGGAKTMIYDATAGPHKGAEVFMAYYTNAHDDTTPAEDNADADPPGPALVDGGVSDLE